MPSLRLFKDVKSFRDLIGRISWDVLKKMALFPVIVFIFSPLIFIIHNFFEARYFWQVISTVNIFVSGYIVFWYILCFCKMLIERHTFGGAVKSNPVIIFFGFFCLLILVSTVINFEQRFTFNCGRASEYFYTYILYAGGYFACAALINDARVKTGLIRLIQSMSMLLFVIVYIDYYLIDIPALRQRQNLQSFSGVFPNRNFYGYYLTVIILVSAALFVIGKDRKWRIFDGVCFLANSFTLMRANTLGCFIAVAVGLVFLFIMLRIVYGRFRWTVLLLIAGFIAMLFLSTLISSQLLDSLLGLTGDAAKIVSNEANAGTAGTGRWKLWTYTVQYISERPFFGWGMNGIFERLEEEAGNSRPHNEYLQYAVYFGIPAALCYISGVLSVFIKGLKKRKELDIYTIAAFAGSFGYLVSAFFGNTMGFTAPYFFIVLGLAVRPCRDKLSET